MSFDTENIKRYEYHQITPVIYSRIIRNNYQKAFHEQTLINNKDTYPVSGA